jgi:carbamoyl-phosphate synthase large subunit
VPEARIQEATGIAPWFVAEMARNVALEADVRAAGPRLVGAPRDPEVATLLATAKRAGFGDHELAAIAGVDESELRDARLAVGLRPGYSMVDTCAAEFAAETPYFYSTYAAAGSEPEAPPVERPAALVIGSGPVRIGQGIEFDYCAVQAAQTLRERGWSAVMINSNPETVSTDFDASTRLYFEPLDPESVRNVIDAESPVPSAESLSGAPHDTSVPDARGGIGGSVGSGPSRSARGVDATTVIAEMGGDSDAGSWTRPAAPRAQGTATDEADQAPEPARIPGLLPAMVAFGGQTPLNLAAPLAAAGVELLGSDLEAIDQAEERTRFSALLDRLGIPQPEGGMAHSVEEALTLAERIGYPVIVRPSFVIGGLAIDFCYSPDDLVRQLAAATVVDPDRPVRIDRYLEGVEVDVDAISDGERVLIPGLLEHVERAGVHSGDSVGVFPPRSVTEWDQDLIVTTMERVVLALGARGLVNAQFIVREDGVYLIEVNPRASRTVPFMSKVTGVPMVELAVRVALGETLAELGWSNGVLEPPPFIAVKAPAFSTAKLRGVDPSVGPGMQSTGEVIGIHTDPRVALAKALLGASLVPPRAGQAGALALLSIADRDKAELPRLGAALTAAGYRLAATSGTRAALVAAGFPAARVAKLGAEPDAGAGEVAILELIASGDVRLVVNTPTPRSGAVRDAAEIRHAATDEGILCLTAIETAVAAAEALDPEIIERLSEVRSLSEWVPAARSSDNPAEAEAVGV